jgi:hypothetical protein
MIHGAWLERMRDGVDEVDADLATRESMERREHAAQFWANAAAKDAIQLGQASARGSTPGGVILVTTLGRPGRCGRWEGAYERTVVNLQWTSDVVKPERSG